MNCLRWNLSDPVDQYVMNDVQVTHVVSISITFGNVNTSTYNISQANCVTVSFNNSGFFNSYSCKPPQGKSNVAFAMTSSDISLERSGVDWSVSMLVNPDNEMRLALLDAFLSTYIYYHDRALYYAIVQTNSSLFALNASLFWQQTFDTTTQLIGMSPETYKNLVSCDTQGFSSVSTSGNDNCFFCQLPRSPMLTATHNIKAFESDQFYLMRNNKLTSLLSSFASSGVVLSNSATPYFSVNAVQDSLSNVAPEIATFYPLSQVVQQLLQHRESVSLTFEIDALAVNYAVI